MSSEIQFQSEEPNASESTTEAARHQNAQLRQSYITQGKLPKDVSYRFSIPSIGRSELTKRLIENNNNPDVIAKSKTKEFKEWNEVVTQASENYTPNDLYQDRFDDPEALWLQGVEKTDGALLGIASPKFKNVEGAELKGEMAVLQFSKKLGVGETFTVPLPHSGICVTIKPPHERDLIDFYNSIFREKIFLGRMSAGLTLTNFSVYINNKLFDFIVRHIHSVNYSDIPKEQLKSYILLHDYHILAWAFAATMYPNGFDHQRPCVNDIANCNHIERETINLLKLLWIDNNSLTRVQKDILCEVRPNRLTVESYRKYTTEHNRVKSRSVTLSNGITFYLRVPTFAEHTSDGLGWVNTINNAIDNLIVGGGDDEDKAKQDLLQQYVSASMLRQYSHFIDYIEDEGNGNVVRDRDTINSLLEVFSAQDDLRAELSEAILKFKSDTTLALVGIPTYDCPVCKLNQNPEPASDKFVSLIPLDVMMLFFTSLTLRISKILERS